MQVYMQLTTLILFFLGSIHMLCHTHTLQKASLVGIAAGRWPAGYKLQPYSYCGRRACICSQRTTPLGRPGLPFCPLGSSWLLRSGVFHSQKQIIR